MREPTYLYSRGDGPQPAGDSFGEGQIVPRFVSGEIHGEILVIGMRGLGMEDKFLF